jgi:predicted ArsR family transcriptional regulator
MSAHQFNARFFESTRGRIVGLLRRAPRTVDELARELELTDNAVRLHLGTLERDGVVRVRGLRREGNVGKPATIYEVAPEAEPGFSKAYLPFLTTLLDVLGERLTSRDLRATMREVGHRLAGAPPADAADVAARTHAAAKLLDALGGVTEVERDGETLVIRGCGCPLSAVVSEREEVCLAVQTMLRDVIGVEVKEHCDRGERPQCRFEVPSAK